MPKVIIRVLIIGMASAALGLVVHRQFIRLSLGGDLIVKTDAQQIKETVAPTLRVIDLAKAKERLDSGNAAFVDARNEVLYQLGHIQGAISFPVADYEKNRNLEKIANLKDSTVVVYCSGKDCPDSTTLAGYLAKEGF